METNLKLKEQISSHINKFIGGFVSIIVIMFTKENRNEKPKNHSFAYN